MLLLHIGEIFICEWWQFVKFWLCLCDSYKSVWEKFSCKCCSIRLWNYTWEQHQWFVIKSKYENLGCVWLETRLEWSGFIPVFENGTIHPLGNNYKYISIVNNIVLRKDGNGTLLNAIVKHPAIHTKTMPKYIAHDLRGPNRVWVPSKCGWLFIGIISIEGLIQ